MSSYEEVVVADFFELKKNPPHDKTIRIYNKKRKGRHRPTVEHQKHRYSNNELAEMITNGFKDVNTRIDQLETRIGRIEARLDYNNLKKLPKNN